MTSLEQASAVARTPHELVEGIVGRRGPEDFRRLSLLGGITRERLQMADFVLMLLMDAAEIRQHAASYRNFGVAAGAWCVGPDRVYGRVMGYNVKIDETKRVNIHAEGMVEQKTRKARYDEVAVMAIIGEPQEDHASGRLMPTLMPCGPCRRMLGESSLVTSQTLFVMARPDFTAVQLAGLAAINNAHDQGSYEGITTFEFPKTPQVFLPRPQADESSPLQVPVGAPEIDSRDYDNTIGAFLTQRYFESQQRA